MIFDKHVFENKKGALFLELFALIRARAGPIWAHMGPRNQKNIKKC